MYLYSGNYGEASLHAVGPISILILYSYNHNRDVI